MYKKDVLDQVNSLKSCSDKIKEHLNAIELLMVDSNNSRTKNSSISQELESLTKHVTSVDRSISSIEGSLK